jgi:hypothetical protein
MKKLPVSVAAAVAGATLMLVAPAGAAGSAIRSTIGAGYLQTPNGGATVTVAETSFRVPQITCARNNDQEALWLGAAGFQGASGTGVNDVYAQVLAFCQAGAITYNAVGEVPGQTQQFVPVSPGDTIDTYFRISTTGSVVQIFKLTKTGAQELVDLVGSGTTDLSVLLGQQDLTLRVPTFLDQKTAKHNVYFTGAWVNGYVLGFDTYPTEQLNQYNKHVEISTSPLSGVSKNKFHLVFDSNY